MGRRINLIPQTERTRTRTDIGSLALIAAIILVIFGLGFGYYMLNNTLSDRKQELADVQQQTALLEDQLAALRQFEQLQSRRIATETVVQGIYAGRTLVADILDSVSLVVPESVWFQNLALTTLDPMVASSAAGQSGVVSAQGDNQLTVEGNTYSFPDVAQVLVRLQLIPALSQIDLVSAGQPRGATDPAKDIKGFSIGASVINTQPADTPLPMSQVEVEGL